MSPVAGLAALLAAAGLNAAAAAEAIPSGFDITTVLDLERPLKPGEYAWNDAQLPDGPERIVIDLDAEQLYVYRSGIEIGRARIVFGAEDKPTPTGLFPILEKNRDHVSNLYNAPMPYMMRLTWDGVAIHGSEVDDEFATHGCIGVPDGFAARLFEAVAIGDLVLVTRGWRPDRYPPVHTSVLVIGY